MKDKKIQLENIKLLSNKQNEKLTMTQLEIPNFMKNLKLN